MDSSPTRPRLLLAFAILPVFQGGVALLVWPIVWWMGAHGAARPIDPEGVRRDFALLTAILGLLVTFAGAAPAVDWLVRRGSLRLTHVLLVGLLLGNAPFAVYGFGLMLPFTVMHALRGTLSEHLTSISSLIAGTARVLVIGSFFGVVSAAVFWLVAIRGTTAEGVPRVQH